MSNAGWKLNRTGAEVSDGTGETVGTFAHYESDDGREVELSWYFTPLGHIYVDGERMSDDPYPFSVDECYRRIIDDAREDGTFDDLVLDVEWSLADHAVSTSVNFPGGTWITGDLEEWDRDDVVELDVDHHGAFEDMPRAVLVDAAREWIEDHATEVLERLDLERVYSDMLEPGR